MWNRTNIHNKLSFYVSIQLGKCIKYLRQHLGSCFNNSIHNLPEYRLIYPPESKFKIFLINTIQIHRAIPSIIDYLQGKCHLLSFILSTRSFRNPDIEALYSRILDEFRSSIRPISWHFLFTIKHLNI